MFTKDFFPFILEMFISLLESCGVTVTDKCYCKKNFISINLLKMSSNITNELYFYVDKLGF